MSQHAMSVTLNRRNLDGGNVYITIGFLGGFTTKYFGINDEIYVGNYAFSQVLWNYWRQTFRRITLSLKVMPHYSLISYVTKEKDCAEDFTDLILRLLNRDYDRDIFESAKQSAIEGYRKAYRDVEFRAVYKLYEFTEKNKTFDLEQLSRDLQTLSFEEFSEQAKKLLVPSNLAVYIDGVTDKVDETEIISINKKLPDTETVVGLAGKTTDPILEKDRHVIAPGRETIAYSALTFDFLNPPISELDRYVLLLFWLEKVRYDGKKAIARLDDADAALIFENEPLKNMKPMIREEITEAEFDEYRETILARYQTLFNDYPEHFGAEAVMMHFAHFEIHEFINVLATMTYENYIHLIREADYKLTAADSVVSKEAVNV